MAIKDKLKTEEVYRAGKFTIAAIFAFILDISLFWLFLNMFIMDYLAATIIAFLIAISIEYFIDRNWSFSDTKTSLRKGYMSYMHLACIGLVAISIFMWIGVDIMKFEPVRTRILIGLIVGIWNYFLNRRFTFNIPLGIHQEEQISKPKSL
jgi:putative flippase GtrA